MDNVGRANWSKNTPYQHTNMRQPNLLGNSNDKLPTSSRLSVDAPEFVPRFNTVRFPRLDDPAIIQHGYPQIPPDMHPSYVNHLHHHQPNHHHQQQQQQQQQQHPHHHHQQQQLPHQQQHHHPHQQQHHQISSHMNKPERSVQNRLNMGRNPGMPQQQQHNVDYNGGSGGGGGGGDRGGFQGQDTIQPSDKESHALDFLNEVMNKLTDNPGMFEEIQRQLTNMFSDLAYNNFVMSNAVEMIFELSMEEQNFRYMGARLCRLLDNVDPRQESVFRTLLCMKMDDHQQKMSQFMQNEKRKVRGTTLFLAELFMQMQNDGMRLNKIAECIVSAMLLLIQNPGPENVKCVCQALKLCGYELELDRPNDIQRIIVDLQKLENSLDVSTGRLLNSVLDLKGKRWGRNEAVVMAPIMESIRHDYNDAPVFYGPDGQVITDEESSFLLSNIPNYPNVHDDYESNDPDELVEAEPEMDLEIQMAFKDFVKSGKNQQQQL